MKINVGTRSKKITTKIDKVLLNDKNISLNRFNSSKGKTILEDGSLRNIKKINDCLISYNYHDCKFLYKENKKFILGGKNIVNFYLCNNESDNLFIELIKNTLTKDMLKRITNYMKFTDNTFSNSMQYIQLNKNEKQIDKNLPSVSCTLESLYLKGSNGGLFKSIKYHDIVYKFFCVDTMGQMVLNEEILKSISVYFDINKIKLNNDKDVSTTIFICRVLYYLNLSVYDYGNVVKYYTEYIHFMYYLITHYSCTGVMIGLEGIKHPGKYDIPKDKKYFGSLYKYRYLCDDTQDTIPQHISIDKPFSLMDDEIELNIKNLIPREIIKELLTIDEFINIRSNIIYL
jgi:hypothetical protein